MKQITSPENPRFKAALKLGSSRGRKQQGRIAIFGRREIERAIKAGVAIDELFCCEELLDNNEVQALEESSFPVYDLPEKLMDRLSFGDRVDGQMAIAKRPSTNLSDVALPENPLIAIVESVEKPGNLGAVLRSADGSGIDAVVVADPLCDPFHPNSIRASLGSVFSIPLACDSGENIRAWTMELGLQVFATLPDADTIYYESDFRVPSAIVFGNEAKGLSKLWQEAVTPIRIPMSGIADSLNLSVSAGVIFYDAVRQRSERTR